jgi:hypothetical protein
MSKKQKSVYEEKFQVFQVDGSQLKPLKDGLIKTHQEAKEWILKEEPMSGRMSDSTLVILNVFVETY